jgi:hypothetical protein
MSNIAKKTLLITLIATMLISSSMTVLQAHACEPVKLTFPPGSNAEAEISASEDPPIFIFGGGEERASVQLLSPLLIVQLPVLPGIVGLYYNVIVTGTFDGQVRVCVHYDPTGMTPQQEKNLRLFIGDPVDFNGDGTVNGQDIALMQKAIKSGANDPRYDINHDTIVNNADLLIVKQFASNGLIVNKGRNGLGQARLAWMDITIGIDTENHYVCGVTDHFSGFGVH